MRSMYINTHAHTIRDEERIKSGRYRGKFASEREHVIYAQHLNFVTAAT